MIKIYKITNSKNGKTYVGQTSKSLKNRFNHHKSQNSKIGNAIRYDGSENFTIESMMEIDDDLQSIADEFEMVLAEKCDSFNNGYNVKHSKGKNGGDTLSDHPNREDIVKKISESKMGDKNPMRINGGLKGERNGMFGKNGIMNPNHRGCKLIDEETKSEIEFDSMADCQRYLGCKSMSPIFNRCNHLTNSVYKGFYIEYTDSE